MNKVRYKYLERICELVDNNEDIVLVSCDYAAPSLDDFRVKHKDRYISVGIAEQNLIQVSCGLALSGHRVIAYGLAPFPCYRAYDQIRNSAAMMHLPISIVSAGIGFAIPEFGATHYATEDMALMRTIPNMKILNLTDETMAKMTADYSLISSTPTYIRIDKYSDGVLYNESDIDFDVGYIKVRNGNDITFITNGYYVNRILNISDQLATEGINAKVIDLFSQPFNEKQLLDEIKHDKKIITVEEHILSGGIGSTILEMFNDNGISKIVKRMGIDFGCSFTSEFGTREYFINKYNLDDISIVSAVKEYIKE